MKKFLTFVILSILFTSCNNNNITGRYECNIQYNYHNLKITKGGNKGYFIQFGIMGDDYNSIEYGGYSNSSRYVVLKDDCIWIDKENISQPIFCFNDDGNIILSNGIILKKK